MAESTLTFELGGQVNIQTLADGMKELHRLVVALTPKEAGIEWIVDDLRSGSVEATLRGEADNQAQVEKVVEEFSTIGKALSEHDDMMHYSSHIQSVANALRALTETVEYVRFATPHDEYIIHHGNGTKLQGTAPLVSVGTVTGTIQTISNRTGLKFNIYDSVHDRAVSCYLKPGQDEEVRVVWGRRARVMGTVARNGITGLPTSIRNIVKIEPLDESETDSHTLARGAVPWQSGRDMPEEVIRRLRDVG